MLNYGGSITSAFPNTFCSSPASLTCQLCNNNINESGFNGILYYSNLSQKYSNPNKLEKCTHCGINICERCLNENQESFHFKSEDLEENGYQTVPSKLNKNGSATPNQSHLHYNTVKKEFKQMYNYSKDIVEKLHLLNNTIKIEESTVSELNLIKHQVNTKALELIKQINQEKCELVEQIENVKRKYESTLNDRKEYYALSMQYKDELRKVIRKYKEFKSEEQCSLNDLLNLYFSVKNISKNLDDYDHIKLITEQDPLQVKFEERPTYRNLIGKLILNQQPFDILKNDHNTNSSDELAIKNENLKEQLKCSSRNIIDPIVPAENLNIINGNLAKLNRAKNQISKNKIFTHQINRHNKNLIEEFNNHNLDLNKDISRSFSLNDLINAANELISNQDKNSRLKHNSNLPKSYNNLNKTKLVNKSNPVLNKNDLNTDDTNYSDENDDEEDENDDEDEIVRVETKYGSMKNLKSNFETLGKYEQKQSYSNKTSQQMFCLTSNQGNYNMPAERLQTNNAPPPPPPLPPHLLTNQSSQLFNKKSNNQFQNEQQYRQSPILKNNSKSSIESVSSSTNNKQMISIQNNDDANSKLIEQYKNKQHPKQRLEIDILPSYLSCSKNRLLISSSYGKIRVVDLFSYKIQKDELKNLLINGICMPKHKSTENENDILYAVTNAEMNEQEDLLNVSNSTIIVTKRELKVLKVEDNNPNDDYMFLNPSGICFDSYDNLYICDSGYNRVKVLDNNLSVVQIIETASNSQDRLSQPKSVATHNNILFVCDSANHRIVSYFIIDEGKDFRFKSIYGYGYGDEPGMLKYPLECCVDQQGILYVRDHHNNRVQVFSTDSTPLHFIEVNSQRETIYSMTVNDNGDVFVAKMVHVQESDQNGQLNTINKYYIDIY